MYLIDTNVVSELRKAKPHGAVLAWIDSVSDANLHLSVVTIGEIQAGIEITREQDAGKARDIEDWLDRVCATWSLLPMTEEIFRAWARLMHRKSADVTGDAMLAATALVHGLTVVSRNRRDFEQFEVTLLDPFTFRR
jgi:toxin FitB